MELPPADEEIIRGVMWGEVYEFPSPAYWAMKVKARQHSKCQIVYRLGSTLAEEVGACLLGGHGIKATVGLAAFRLLKTRGVFKIPTPQEHQIHELLLEPLLVDNKQVRYRFARQKARYLSNALTRVNSSDIPQESGKSLRHWLCQLPGIGLKTSSWVARNWLDADDVAILDIHILRAGIICGFFNPDLRVEKDYFELEERFLEFSRGLGVRPSELDSVMWLEMMSSPLSVKAVLAGR